MKAWKGRAQQRRQALPGRRCQERQSCAPLGIDKRRLKGRGMRMARGCIRYVWFRKRRGNKLGKGGGRSHDGSQ
jgi:hypothetical protein